MPKKEYSDLVSELRPLLIGETLDIEAISSVSSSLRQTCLEHGNESAEIASASLSTLIGRKRLSILCSLEENQEINWDENWLSQVYSADINFSAEGAILEQVNTIEPKDTKKTKAKFSLKSDDWMSIFTREFKKSMSALDLRLRGRIADAILDISSMPNVVRGDTQKPLGNDMKGKWRYRLGDYRLIYLPLLNVQTIYYLDVASRGSIYDG